MRTAKVAIVGAGPAGLGAAFSLARGGIRDVVVLEKGRRIEERVEERSLGCESRLNITCGEGGAGAFSDGKLNFDLNIGWNTDSLSKAKKEEGLTAAEELFLRYGISCDSAGRGSSSGEPASYKSGGMLLAPARKIAHVGSDMLPGFVRRVRDDLAGMGVSFESGDEIISVKAMDDGFVLTSAHGQALHSEFLVLGVGRTGSRWLKTVADELGMKNHFGYIDIGVRVEVPASLMGGLTNLYYEPKIYMTSDTYGDDVRTFCVCPDGFVVSEPQEYNGSFLTGVNGHSNAVSPKSSNTNFALLSKVNLTQPMADTGKYGKVLSLLATVIGDDKPIVQRWSDFVNGRRSTYSRIAECPTKPTLWRKRGGDGEFEVTPGDISLAAPYRIALNLKEALFKLENLFPGIAGSQAEPSLHALLYFPEPKFYSTKIAVNESIETTIPKVYAVGDGAGQTRGLVPAMITGLFAGQDIASKAVR